MEELEVSYKEGNLEILNKEFKKYGYDCEYLQLSSIDLKDKKFKMMEYGNKQFTLYEYCILLQKYRYIK